MSQVPGSPGRRLRLQRRKSGLDQEGLARLLGVDKATVSEMENNRAPLSSEAEAFLASPPQKVPAPSSARPGRRAEKPGGGGARATSDPAPEPLPNVEEQPDGPGPRVEVEGDRKPKPEPSRDIRPLPREGEIEELEHALRILFAGESFLVPREQPDGTVQHVEAIVPGLAQLIGTVDEFDGMIIRTYAPGMAKAWADLARENATVRKILIGMTYGGAYRGVIAASLPPLMAIAVHHGAFGLGRPAPPPVVEQEPPPGSEEYAAATHNGSGAFDPPEFIDNGDGTWTHPGSGQVGVFGPQGWLPIDRAEG